MQIFDNIKFDLLKSRNLDLRSYGQILSLFDSTRILTEKNMIISIMDRGKKIIKI